MATKCELHNDNNDLGYSVNSNGSYSTFSPLCRCNSSKFRIGWTMPNGYSGYGGRIFYSEEDAQEFINHQKKIDKNMNWIIAYRIERV